MQLQENLFQSRKDGSHENVATVVTQAEIWGTASERELSQALHYKYDALKDKLLRDALVTQVGVTEWAALSESDRFTKLAQMKLKVQALQREGSTHVTCVLRHLFCSMSKFCVSNNQKLKEHVFDKYNPWAYN